MEDYYRILDVARDSSQAEIKKAFRRMALIHHPDRNPLNQKQAEEKFKQINQAYQVLGDEDQRRQYDYLTTQSQYRRGSFMKDIFSDEPSVQGLDEETMGQILEQLAAVGFRFKGCGGGYGRRCRRW